MEHLIEISFGPVQDFIAAARRTSDLWAGSRLLSESVRAACIKLKDLNAELIYPDESRLKNNNQEQSNFSNIILAKISGGPEDAKSIIESAMRAGKEYVEKLGRDALEKFPQLRQDLFICQLEDSLEFYAAWSAFSVEGEYPVRYKALKQALNQRKNTRDFLPFYVGNSQNPCINDFEFLSLPKNSFDGLRETVLPEGKPDRRIVRGLRLSDGEQLDALGVLKRTIGKEKGFTPLTRLAAHDWLQKMTDEDIEILKKCYEPLVGHELATRVKGNKGAYDKFPYDASLLYPERLEIAFKEAETCDYPVEAKQSLQELRKMLSGENGLWKTYSRPLPYAALLVADGDRMGKFVSGAQNSGHHKDLTKSLAGFADKAIDICRFNGESCVGGQAIYAGGEDVMAMLPLSAVLDVPRRLADEYADQIKEIWEKIGENDKPTLRVGVAIAHVQTPLGTIRQWADAAEKFAKGEAGTDRQGNALGLRLHIRAGHMLSLRLPFNNDLNNDHSSESLFVVLRQWIDLYKSEKEGNRKLPGRLGYDLRSLGEEIKLHKLPDSIAYPEFKRFLNRIRQEGGSDSVDKTSQQKLLDRLESLIKSNKETSETGQSALLKLGEELILARWISAHSLSDLGEKV